MRRFIKTFTVRRHVQFTVVQDGDAKAFIVSRWAAADEAPEEICRFDYYGHDAQFTLAEAIASAEGARGEAIAEALRLRDAEMAGQRAVGQAG